MGSRRAAETVLVLPIHLCKLNETESVALVTVTHSERLAARMGRTCVLNNGTLTPNEVHT